MPLSGPSPALLLPRVLGALALRRSTFSAVAGDTGAGFQAGLLILIIGMLEATVDAAVHQHPTVTTGAIVLGVLWAVVGWVTWSAILWGVISRGFGHEVDFPSAVRVVAFAHSPRLVYGLGVVDIITLWIGFLYLATLVWFVAAMITAISGWLDVPARRASLIFVAGWLVQVFLFQVAPYAFRLVPAGE